MYFYCNNKKIYYGSNNYNSLYEHPIKKNDIITIFVNNLSKSISWFVNSHFIGR